MDPVRILHVVTYMGRGGLETMIMNFYRHVDRSLVQFDFLTHRNFQADYDDEIEALGGRIYHLPKLIPWSNSYNKALDGFLESHPEYKIIHVHQDCLSSVILKVAKKRGIPVRIAHSHSSSQDKNLKYLIKLFYMRRIPKYATELFACGKNAGDWMFRGAPYIIINNAVDAKKYAFSPTKREQMRSSLGIGISTLVVGHVGRFNTVKNHKFLIDVFAQLKKQREDAVLLLVGDGDLRNDMIQKVKSLNLESSVIFTGLRSDIPELMQAIDVFVFPSLYEGVPLTLVEAQAAGLPCLVSDGVPKECAITALVKHTSLKKSLCDWVRCILELAKIKRSDTSGLIVQAGYDLETTAQWLQNYYLEQWKKVT